MPTSNLDACPHRAERHQSVIRPPLAHVILPTSFVVDGTKCPRTHQRRSHTRHGTGRWCTPWQRPYTYKTPARALRCPVHICGRHLSRCSSLCTGCYKLSDFGVSHFLRSDDDDALKNLSGTPLFAAPETCKGLGESYSGKAADIWALGITLYALIYGQVCVAAWQGDALLTPETFVLPLRV